MVEAKWLVVIAREGVPEVTLFGSFREASAYFDEASTQWTESYLTHVISGPGNPVELTDVVQDIRRRWYEAGAAAEREAQTKDARRPQLVWQSNGEAGDGQMVCKECGDELDTPHTWAECAESRVNAMQQADAHVEWWHGEEIARLEREIDAAQTSLAEAVSVLREMDQRRRQEGDCCPCPGCRAHDDCFDDCRLAKVIGEKR